MSSDDFGDQQCRTAFEFWKSLAAAGGLPTLDDFDLLEVPDLLPTFYQVDLTDKGNTATVRLVGTEGIQTHGADRTGYVLARDKWDDEVNAGLKRFFGLVFYAYDCRSPCAYGPVEQRVDGREFLSIEVVGLPLTSGGDDVGSVVGIVSAARHTEE